MLRFGQNGVYRYRKRASWLDGALLVVVMEVIQELL